MFEKKRPVLVGVVGLVLLLIITGYYLYPTFSWYFLLNDREKRLIRMTRKEFDQKVEKIAEETLARIEKEERLEPEYTYLQEALEKNYISVYDIGISEQEAYEKLIKNEGEEDELPEETVEEKAAREREEKKQKERKRKISILTEYYRDKKTALVLHTSKVVIKTQAYYNVFLSARYKIAYEDFFPRASMSEEEKRKAAAKLLKMRLEPLGEIAQFEEHDTYFLVTMGRLFEGISVRDYIEKKGIIDFALISEEGTESLERLIRDKGLEEEALLTVNGELLPQYKQLLPPGTKVVQACKTGWLEKENNNELFVIEGIPLFKDGFFIEHASTSYSMDANSSVQLAFDSSGAIKFADITGRNSGKQLAMMIDEEILLAAAIKEEISGGIVSIHDRALTPIEYEMAAALTNTGQGIIRFTVLSETKL